MTRLMACAPTCGAAAAVIVSETFARRHNLDTTVSIAAQAMTTDTPDTFAANDMMQLVGYGMTQAAARQVYAAAGIGPEDVDVVELHDCFAQNELISYEALGLCPEGGAENSSPTPTTRTVAASWSILRAASCRKGIRSARPGSRSATS